MNKIRIGISVGDINGIGLEVILKTLSDERLLNYYVPVIYGSSKVISYHRNIVHIESFLFNNIRAAEEIEDDKVNIINCWKENVNIKLGKVTEQGGKYAFLSLERAVEDLKMGLIDGLVTAPINKKAMQMTGFPFPGHTEYLTEAFDVKESLMLLVNGDLRVGLVTNHLPVRDIAKAITKDKIVEKIEIMHETLKIDFGIDLPKIAVLSLNPHASDDGLIGDEEHHIIIPAIEIAKEKDIMAIGPYPADGFFGSGQYKKFDGILAMYHDQGLVAFKALSFGSGVNYTGGLPVVRTSPDHGTALDIAGMNMADPSSFRSSLFLAFDVIRNRKDYFAMHENPLKKQDEKELAEQLKAEEARIREEAKQQKQQGRQEQKKEKKEK